MTNCTEIIYNKSCSYWSSDATRFNPLQWNIVCDSGGMADAHV
ncbi:hypothetical protein [Clostridium sp.]|nr:hypothetical protein [uncultured Clostridium sp.]